MVVVADHSDVAAAVRHLLGARGVINVTVQAGQRLAAELAGPAFRALGDTDARGARPPLRPLNRLGESQAVRRIADDWLESAGLRLSQMGRRRLYAELTDAFRQREQRPTEDVADTESPDDTGLNLPRLYDEYRALLDREGYYTRHQLSGTGGEGPIRALAGRHGAGGHLLPAPTSPGRRVGANADLAAPGQMPGHHRAYGRRRR